MDHIIGLHTNIFIILADTVLIGSTLASFVSSELILLYCRITAAIDVILFIVMCSVVMLASQKIGSKAVTPRDRIVLALEKFAHFNFNCF